MKLFLLLLILCTKTIIVFCINNFANNEVIFEDDCTKIRDFLSKNGYSIMVNCCQSSYINCNSWGDITSITLKGDIYYNNELPKRFFDIPNLQTLDVSYSVIRSIPKTVNSNSPIMKLYLNNNEIATIFPYQFCSLKNLKVLNLNYNFIRGDLLFHNPCSTIEELYLRENNMSGTFSIPETLNSINILNNRFDTLYIKSYTKDVENYSLENFEIGYNKNIKSIKSSFFNLKSLEKIDFSGLSITELPNELFHFPNLKFLNISYNPQLNAKIYKYDRSIDNCDFTNTKINCYNPESCSTIIGGNESTYNKKSEDVFITESPSLTLSELSLNSDIDIQVTSEQILVPSKPSEIEIIPPTAPFSNIITDEMQTDNTDITSQYNPNIIDNSNIKSNNNNNNVVDYNNINNFQNLNNNNNYSNNVQSVIYSNIFNNDSPPQNDNTYNEVKNRSQNNETFSVNNTNNYIQNINDDDDGTNNINNSQNVIYSNTFNNTSQDVNTNNRINYKEISENNTDISQQNNIIYQLIIHKNKIIKQIIIHNL
ncbi:L domain-like protein [Piromyces finnis]|uniref:L domain-like protein n=1 Tax=Piromyces finnis TaxID=1754191 RepID=A0A1Y1V3H0_9FUNG|nr:L domain-like protein [Piromyces finnis]|eukprot:ORX46243.1 L domain-like protein [Piromyces finnis]